MAGLARPTTPRQVTASWLTQALQSSGVIEPHIEVGSVRQEPLGGGTGVFGTLVRLVVDYTEPNSGPTSMVLKIPTTAPENKAVGLALGLYVREGQFFRQMAGRTPVDLVGCYYNDMDVEAGEFVLVLEEIRDLQVGQQTTGATVGQLEIMPRPPEVRGENNPWPQWSLVYRTSSAHEEGGERIFSVNTERFVDDGNGNVSALVLNEVRFVNGAFEVIPGTAQELRADLVFLALGFVGPEKGSWLDTLGVQFDARGNVARTDDYATNVPGVFVAGDMGRGQSLIVWAIAEGRSCASAVDEYLMGTTTLPTPIAASTRPLA